MFRTNAFGTAALALVLLPAALPAQPAYTAPQAVATPAPAAAEPAAAEPAADEVFHVVPEDIFGFKITGWVYGTGNYNATNGGGTRYNGPMTTNDQTGGYLNQLWLSVKRDLGDEFGIGGGFDLIYGNDYLASQSRGFENARARGWLPKWNDNQDYGLAIPQAYLDIGTKDYTVKLGHFYTPHGYMTVQAPNNFFNTLPWGFMMTNPFTHWGGMATANLNENFQVMFGLVNGWDALDRPTNALAYMGGFKITFPEKKGFYSLNMITGLEPENRGAGYSNRTLFTSVFDYNLTDALEFVLEGNYGWQANDFYGTDEFYNVVPYCFFKLSDTVKLGFRYEYFWDPFGFTAAERVGNPNNGPIPANVVAGPYRGSFHTLAGGVNWAPLGGKNLMIRPEIRYDWFNGYGVGGDPFNAGKRDHQIMMVLGAYMQF